MKFNFCVFKAFLISSSLAFVILIFDTQSILSKPSPNILFLPKLFTKLVFPQPVCPTTKILSENVASYVKFSLFARSGLRRNFLSFEKSLYFCCFKRYFLPSQYEKMLAFAAIYFYRWKFCCFFHRKFFHLDKSVFFLP